MRCRFQTCGRCRRGWPGLLNGAHRPRRAAAVHVAVGVGCGRAGYAGVDQAVAVGDAAADVAALGANLRCHRVLRPVPGPDHLAVGQDAQQFHQLVELTDPRVQPAADLRHPQLYSGGGEQWRDQGELIAEECPLVGADHHRVEAPVRIGQSRQQRRRARPHLPRRRAGPPDIGVLGCDPAGRGSSARPGPAATAAM